MWHAYFSLIPDITYRHCNKHCTKTIFLSKKMTSRWQLWLSLAKTIDNINF